METETVAPNDNASAHRNLDLLRHFHTAVYAIQFTFKRLQEGLAGDLRTSADLFYKGCSAHIGAYNVYQA